MGDDADGRAGAHALHAGQEAAASADAGRRHRRSLPVCADRMGTPESAHPLLQVADRLPKPVPLGWLLVRVGPSPGRQQAERRRGGPAAVNRAGMLRYRGVRHHRARSRPADRRVAVVDLHRGKIKKIPLDIDETLVSDGTGTALDPASLSRRAARRRQERAAGLRQQQITVEVAGQRRCGDTAGRHVGATHRQATGQRTAAGHGRHRHPQPQQRHGRVRANPSRRLGTEAARHRRTTSRRPRSRCRTTAWPTGSRSTPRRRRTRTSTRSPRRRSTPTTTARKTSTD